MHTNEREYWGTADRHSWHGKRKGILSADGRRGSQIGYGEVWVKIDWRQEGVRKRGQYPAN